MENTTVRDTLIVLSDSESDKQPVVEKSEGKSEKIGVKRRADGVESMTSNVWNFFDKLVDEEKVQCKTCNKKLVYKGAHITGTSSLRRHLDSNPIKHKEWYILKKESEEAGPSRQKQKTMDLSVNIELKSSSAVIPITVGATQFESKLYKFLITLDEPFLLLEKPEFKDLFTDLKPSVSLPSRKTARNNVSVSFIC